VPIDGLDGLIPIAEEILKKKEKKYKDFKNMYKEDSAADSESEEFEEEKKA
jgi:hypothetical protein